MQFETFVQTPYIIEELKNGKDLSNSNTEWLLFKKEPSARDNAMSHYLIKYLLSQFMCLPYHTKQTIKTDLECVIILLMMGVSIGNRNKKPTSYISSSWVCRSNHERGITAGLGVLYQRMVVEALVGVPLMAWKIPTESDRGLLGLSSTGFIWGKKYNVGQSDSFIIYLIICLKLTHKCMRKNKGSGTVERALPSNLFRSAERAGESRRG